MITLNDLSFTYEHSEVPALSHIQLQIEDGDFVGITGESGAGKSTLGYTLNGVIPHHYQGEFFGSSVVMGHDTFETSLEDLSRLVGSVFQDIDGQMVSSVVEDEILFGMENFGIPKEELEERLLFALRETGILPLRHRSISSLSGGQKQKVALSAVIALRPKLLVLDEPTGELDPKSSHQIFTLLKKLNETYGITVVVIEQKIMLLCEFVKTLLVMKNGQITHQGAVREVLTHSRELADMGINCPRIVTLANRLQDLGVAGSHICLTVPEAADMLRSLPIFPAVPDTLADTSADKPCTSVKEAVTASNASFISFDHVSYQYRKGSPTIQDISFSIKKGDFAALTGSNGAGKSTLSKMFNGLLKPTSGNVLIDGQNTKVVRTSELAKKIGFLFQNPDIQICQNTVREEILFGLKCIYKDPDIIQQKYKKILQEFPLKEDANPFNLSRGERQIVALASVLAPEPEILLLDEPTTGLDYRECMDIMNIMKERSQQGTTIIMVCHDMELVLDFAKTMFVISEGQLMGQGSPREVFQNQELLDSASLLPPQIARLSQQLGGTCRDIFTVDEMIERMELK